MDQLKSQGPTSSHQPSKIESAKAPFFFYTDEKGREHVVWYEDARSFQAKTDLIKEYSLAGGGIWNLMRENPQGYVTLNSLLNIK